MGYLWTLVIVAVALVGLVVLVLAALGPLRRMSVVSTALQAELRDRGGMLAARIAALKVRLAQRREARHGAADDEHDELPRSSAGV